MKYYIILQPSIRSMGGEEMYTRNKVIAAREQGYEPIVFHSGIGDRIYIDDLKAFDEFQFDAFRYEYCVVPGFIKKRMAKRIHTILNDVDGESVVESHEVLIAEWGEWLAKELGCRHLAFILLEHNPLQARSIYDLFLFKYNRHELVGIVKETIPDMFKEYAPEEKFCTYELPAHCKNSYEDIPCPEAFRVKTADFTIGSIGRTNKIYVPQMIRTFVEFANKYKNKKVNVLYIGGSMDKESERYVIETLSAVSNINLIFTGLIFPISVEMIRQMDVCVASAGSCGISINCGVPTISLDGNDGMAIGVYQKTTKHFLFRDENEPPIKTIDLLEEILVNKTYTKEDKLVPVNVDFKSHWDFVKEMDKTKDYYDLEKLNLPLPRKMVSLAFGYLYGLNSNSLKYRLLHKLILMLK